ncbi:MAG: diguanylate cyclase [Nitrospirota bacterium]|nr:diguanylate cyclase [Nitrospirota bacterium]
MSLFVKPMKTKARNIIAGTVLAASLVWTADAVLDSIVHHDGTFSDLFAGNVPIHGIVFRILFAAVIIVGAYSYAKVREKRVISTDELQRHLAAVEASMDGVAIYDKNGNYLYVNEAYARINGYKGTREVIGKNFRLVYGDNQREWMERNIPPELERTGKWHGELLAQRKDGTAYIQEVSVSRLPDGGRICIIRDITDRKQREEALKRSERLLNSIFASIHDPFCVLDESYRIIKANKAYAELKEKSLSDILDHACYKTLEGKNEVCDGCVIRKTFQSGDPCAKEKKVTLRSGETLWLEIFTYPITDEQGKTIQVIEYTRDVTDRKKSDDDRKRLIDRLEILSSVDGLTGLLNRRALTEQLTYEIDRARRYGSALSIILCDMDNLKEINDRHGHLAGDMAIQMVSATLRNVLRSVDIAGRYGGDEFLLIVPETQIEGVRSLAEKIREAIQRTEIRVDKEKTLAMSLSMGIATLASLPEDVDGLISRVDTALYNSKHSGRNRISVAE